MSVTQLLSVRRAAAVLDCSAGHVYDLIAQGRLRAVEIKAQGSRSKTRIREEDLQDFIEASTRSAGRTPRPTPAEHPRTPRLELYPGSGTEQQRRRDVYGTRKAAAYAQIETRHIVSAISAGDLHATRNGPQGRWRIQHGCLAAWLDQRPCEHQDGGATGEVRRVDGT